jgi:D-glycerate 3-kinase
VVSTLCLLEQWCLDRSAAGHKLLGLCAPPGSGKSWLASQLQSRLDVACLSLDDLYWPQPRLQQHQRGLPGSHDLPLLKQVLTNFRLNGTAFAPCFVKELAAGAGDRLGECLLAGDLLLLEGWCVGARGVPALQPYQAIWQQLDGLLLLRPPSFGRVMRWRLEAEAKQRRQGGGALPARLVAAMVRSFYQHLPVEQCFAPLWQQPQLPTWQLKLNYKRQPLGFIEAI